MANAPVFTAIVCTYNRPTLLKEAVAALRRQTYENLEIILINKGVTPDTIKHLQEVEAADKRVKLVHFKDNVLSADDPAKHVGICFNASLNIATGDYIWAQSDDDFMADDYTEKMVALFQENPECTTAAGLPVSIDIDGRINETQYEHCNIRPRYTEGQKLAIDHIMGTQTMYTAPGTIFTIKRDVLIQTGGFHRAMEDSHLYGIVPFGMTGFDSSALFYWRHHSDQYNKKATTSGHSGAFEVYSLLKDWQIERRWQVFGRETAREVVEAKEREQYTSAAVWMTGYLYSRNFGAALDLVRTMWGHPQFWFRTSLRTAWRAFYTRHVRSISRPLLLRAFRLVPVLSSFPPGWQGFVRESIGRRQGDLERNSASRSATPTKLERS